MGDSNCGFLPDTAEAVVVIVAGSSLSGTFSGAEEEVASACPRLRDVELEVRDTGVGDLVDVSRELWRLVLGLLLPPCPALAPPGPCPVLFLGPEVPDAPGRVTPAMEKMSNFFVSFALASLSSFSYMIDKCKYIGINCRGTMVHGDGTSDSCLHLHPVFSRGCVRYCNPALVATVLCLSVALSPLRKIHRPHR